MAHSLLRTWHSSVLSMTLNYNHLGVRYHNIWDSPSSRPSKKPATSSCTATLKKETTYVQSIMTLNCELQGREPATHRGEVAILRFLRDSVKGRIVQSTSHGSPSTKAAKRHTQSMPSTGLSRMSVYKIFTEARPRRRPNLKFNETQITISRHRPYTLTNEAR